MVLRDWLLLLSSVFSVFIHVVAGVMLHPFDDQIIFHCMDIYHILGTHSSLDGPSLPFSAFFPQTYSPNYAKTCHDSKCHWRKSTQLFPLPESIYMHIGRAPPNCGSLHRSWVTLCEEHETPESDCLV